MSKKKHSLDYIKALILLAKEEGLSKLKVKGKNKSISIEFSHGEVITKSYSPVSQKALSITNEIIAPSLFHEIKSPFVGTFYMATAPGKPPLSKVGQMISKGQSLCIVEAMKIMNEIESDVQGEIVEICVENENLVEFGQVLFRVKV